MEKLNQQKIKICVPIKERSNTKVIEKLKLAQEKGADLCEIWLGEIEDLDLEAIFTVKKIPLVVNVKGESEQGSFKGTESEKVDLLLKAVEMGVEYADIAYENHTETINDFVSKTDKKSKIIISHHFWENTPPLPALLNISSKMLNLKADIVKLCTSSKTQKDLLTILRLAENLNRKNISHITILMGELGKSSRILIPSVYGGEFTFATLDKNSSTASGQFSIDEIKEVEKMLSV
ncbi:MAG: type I 3-dehydroquinate dehydratase [Candidatus Gracilibacteria bacterium]|jgi:3-dehydroquinate dehydratase-1|nr:type I 3-dehydroquinate dehydratase [Candidatus Gracilibacteria bacterium]